MGAEKPKKIYIAISGGIGSGKTTLACALQEKLGILAILEDFRSNPFFGAFSRNPSLYAFETEIAFTLLHYHQIKNALLDRTCNTFVSDFYIGQDLLYADTTLNADEKPIYDQVFSFIKGQTPEPDALVYLKASTDLLMSRIRKRSRDTEESISRNYLRRLNQAHIRYFSSYRKPNLLLVDIDKHDLLHNENALRELLRELKNRLPLLKE